MFWKQKHISSLQTSQLPLGQGLVSSALAFCLSQPAATGLSVPRKRAGAGAGEAAPPGLEGPPTLLGGQAKHSSQHKGLSPKLCCLSVPKLIQELRTCLLSLGCWGLSWGMWLWGDFHVGPPSQGSVSSPCEVSVGGALQGPTGTQRRGLPFPQVAAAAQAFQWILW